MGPKPVSLTPETTPLAAAQFTAEAYQSPEATSAKPAEAAAGRPSMAYRVWTSMARVRVSSGANRPPDTPDMRPFSYTYSTAL